MGGSEARASSCVGGLSMVAASEVCLSIGVVLAGATAVVVLEALLVVVVPCFVRRRRRRFRSRRSRITGMVASFCTCVV